jgi:hypothetical protein
VTFHGYTITPAGMLISYRVHESGQLVQATVAGFSRMLTPGEDFCTRVPSPGTAVIDLEWSARSGAAHATFYANDAPISTSFVIVWRGHRVGARSSRGIPATNQEVLQAHGAAARTACGGGDRAAGYLIGAVAKSPFGAAFRGLGDELITRDFVLELLESARQ